MARILFHFLQLRGSKCTNQNRVVGSEQKIIKIQNGLSVASAYGQLSLNEITNGGKATSIRILINLPSWFAINSS